MRTGTVAIDLPAEQRLLLRSDMEVCLSGAREDLQRPQLLADPDRSVRRAAAYERLIEALRRGVMELPDEEARVALREVADGLLEGIEWAREKPLHDAQEAMLAILGSGLSRPERQGASIAPGEDLETERVVLLRVIDVHPAPLTGSELIRELGGGDASSAEIDAIERAAHGLAAVGLLHHRDGFLTPTRAALRFAELDR